MREYKELIWFGVFIILAIAACFVFAYWQVEVSQHHWCSALDTLTQVKIPYPADASKNPSRLEAYNLYEEFVRIKGDFGCG